MLKNKYNIKLVQGYGKNKHMIYFSAEHHNKPGCGFLIKKHKQNLIRKAKVHHSGNQRIGDTNNLDLKRIFYKALTFPPHSGTTLARVYYQCISYSFHTNNYIFQLYIAIRKEGEFINIPYTPTLRYNPDYNFKLTKKILEECHYKNSFRITVNYLFTPTIEKEVWEFTEVLEFSCSSYDLNDCKKFIMTIPTKNKIKIINNAHFNNVDNLLSLRPENFKYLKEIMIIIPYLHGGNYKKNKYIILRYLAKFMIEKVSLKIGLRSDWRIFNITYLNKIRTNLERYSYIKDDII